jgi:N utilization substance protein B
MAKRTTARRLAMQAIFQMDIDHFDKGKGFTIIEQEKDCLEETKDYAKQLFKGVADNLEKVDSTLKKHLIAWDFSRLAKVDKAILRLACFELLFEKELSANIIINEAIELGKKFGDKDSSRFINGVLDAVYREISDAIVC